MKSSLRLTWAVLALAPALCGAQVARVELIPFQSVTMSDQDFLNGRKDGKPVTLAGELRIPRPGTDKLPAVVLLHGSRGIVQTSTNQASLGRLAMTYDAYRALEVLDKHARIDGNRVAVMGFSRGGQAALYASLKRFQKMHGAAGGRDFAAYIPFYASCGTKFIADEEVSPRPIRLFHGAADN